jgi:hypothetical protein
MINGQTLTFCLFATGRVCKPLVRRMSPSRSSASSRNFCSFMAPGVISDCRSSFSVCFSIHFSNSTSSPTADLLFPQFSRFVLQEYRPLHDPVLRKLTSFPRNAAVLTPKSLGGKQLTFLPLHISVLVLQQLFRSNRLRILDALFLQRRLHPPPSARHRHLRSVRQRPNAGPVPSALSAWTEELLLLVKGVLDVDGERYLP